MDRLHILCSNGREYHNDDEDDNGDVLKMAPVYGDSVLSCLLVCVLGTTKHSSCNCIDTWQ